MKRVSKNSPNKQARRAKTLPITIEDAIKIDDVNRLETLCENDASLNNFNEEGYHALHFAAINNALRGPNHSTTDSEINIELPHNKDGYTALHFAVLSEHTATVEKLVVMLTSSIMIDGQCWVQPLEGS